MDTFTDRRQKARCQADFRTTVQALGRNKRLDSRILDLSAEGLAIFSPEPLGFGDPVSVTYKGVLILAEIVYCIPFGAGYRAGLKIDQAMATIAAEASMNDVTRELQSALKAFNAERST